MTHNKFIKSNLAYYWRTNLAVIAGVATAVAVLAGALLVGDSVRGSLRKLALQRLGKTDLVLAGNNFFREQLANDLQAHPAFAANFNGVCPLITLPGTVTNDENNSRAGNVAIYGVDERFWQFHGLTNTFANNDEAFISPGLARELNAAPENQLVVRIEKPTDIPLESLHGRKDEAGATIRVTLRATLPASQMGEFALRPQQGAVRAVFMSLQKLRKYFEQDGKVNTLLLAAKSDNAQAVAEQIVREKFTLADLGLKLRALPEQLVFVLENDSAILNNSLADAATRTAKASNLAAAPILTYLANTIRIGNKEIPYSLVTALDQAGIERLTTTKAERPANAIILNQWAANDAGAQRNQSVTLEYFVWQDGGQLKSESATFTVSDIIPMQGAALDRNYAPDYPGITDTNSLSDWDPPFPLDLERVRKQDETYWDQYRTTPKAFILLPTAQKLWATRHGSITSLRLLPATGTDLNTAQSQYAAALRQQLDPLQHGLNIMAVKTANTQAARGATDFGEYFSYFSFFLVVSALLLTGLFFKLGIEQRLREIGLLRALGYSLKQIRSLFLREGLLLAVIGSLLGLLGAVAFGWLMMFGLRTWWVGAVGTTLLELHIAPRTLLIGFAAGIITALLVIALTLRQLLKRSPRGLLVGSWQLAVGDNMGKKKANRFAALNQPRLFAMLFGLIGLLLLLASATKRIGATGGFFGAGFTLLIAALFGWSAWLGSDKHKTIAGQGWRALAQLGFRNASLRAGRSVLCIALIAAASFIIVAVTAFRRDGAHTATNDKQAGTGGYALLAESLVPIVRDPNSAQGREELNLNDTALKDVSFTRMRLRPGDDTSCLNLYAPQNPRILGASAEFINQGRFTFANSLAQTPEQKANPWLLLNTESAIGNPQSAIPIIGDANSLMYVLHKSVGDTFEIDADNGQRVTLRIVAALQDSVLQSELVMAESDFTRIFPSRAGHQVFLLDAPDPAAASALLEKRLSDYGFDATNAAEKLASFHQVENTYLSTFQALGALGLLLGTIGLAAVLLRNVLERRRELALLRATGYQPQHLSWLILAENLFLLGSGLLTGCACAALAIAPALATRSGSGALWSLLGLLLLVLATGMLASLLAVRAVSRMPLLASLRAE